MKRRKQLCLLVFATLFVGGGVLFAGGQSDVPAGERPVVIVQGADADTLDANAVWTVPSMIVFSNIFDTLLDRDDDMNIIPGLAESYELVEPPTRWRFNLRQDVKFHNGEAFTAASVKFSFDRISAPDSDSLQKGNFSTIDRVEIVDDYVVDIITKDADPILPARMTMFFMVPPEHVKEVGKETFGTNPVGSGPYKFVSWRKDDSIELVRNEQYWGGVPEIKRVTFRNMPETQSRLAALQTGEADIVIGIPLELAQPLMGSKEFSFESVLSTRVVYAELTPLEKQTDSPLWNEDVRRAINYAVNRESIIKNLLTGEAEIIPTIVPRGIPGFDSSIEPYNYNPEKAKELLKKAGYPNGFEIRLYGFVGRLNKDSEIAQAVGGDLDKVGIKTQVVIEEFGVLAKNTANKTMTSPYMQSWALPVMDPDQWLWPQLHSGEFFTRTENADLDRILEASRREMNPEKREELLSQAQRISHDKAYKLILFQLKNSYGMSSKISVPLRNDEMIYLKDAVLVK